MHGHQKSKFVAICCLYMHITKRDMSENVKSKAIMLGTLS